MYKTIVDEMCTLSYPVLASEEDPARSSLELDEEPEPKDG
jgi:hypothetical protein